MHVTLSDGRVIRCSDDAAHSGAEGELYFSQDGHSVVKLYLHGVGASRDQQLDAIIRRYNAVRDQPFWERYFCWPAAIVIKPRLGVTMPRAPANLRGLDWFLLPKARDLVSPNKRGTWMGHVGIALRLSRAMRRLHQLGLCHSDLSHKNCLVDPVTGQLRLIDLDCLVVPGILPPQVFGTTGFMAPEIITASARPSIATDLHSLAVLVYQILLFRHPLKGPKFHSTDTEEDDRLAYGHEALYIEHPRDRSNRPRQTFVDSSVLGPRFQSLMQQAFISGLHQPTERPQAGKWEEALVRIQDRILPCLNRDCELKYFAFLEGGRLACPWCKTPWRAISTLATLDLYRPVSGRQGQYVQDDYSIVAHPDRHLYEWHIHPGRPPGPESDRTPRAGFRYDDRNSQWLMVNQSSDKWRLLDETNARKDIGPNKEFVLKSDIRVLLGEDSGVRLALVRVAKVH